MKSIAPLVLAVFALTLASCSPAHTVDAAVLNGVVQPVCDRHDAYVNTGLYPDGLNADGSQKWRALSPTEQSTYLRSSTLAKTIIDTAMQPVGTERPATP